mgnify:CR=1 FL=1
MAGNRCRKRAIPAGAPVMVEVTFMEPFEYIKPSSPAEASAILAAEGSAARILQGGTDLIIRMRGDFIHPKIVVDLKGLPGMRDVAFNPDDGLILGAAVTMNEVATHPAILAHYRMLADACETVGSYQLRNRATIGGNVCNASPAGDSRKAAISKFPTEQRPQRSRKSRSTPALSGVSTRKRSNSKANARRTIKPNRPCSLAMARRKSNLWLMSYVSEQGLLRVASVLW